MRASMEALSLMQARQAAWSLFHRLLGTAPSEELVKAVSSQEMLQCLKAAADGYAVTRLAGQLETLRGAASDPDVMRELRSEYTRAFEAPELPSVPWEGAREGLGLLFGEKTLAVRASYLEAGFEPAHVRSVPDDHIALEAAFMAVLAERQAHALEAGNGDVLELAAAQQERFLREHLTRWAPQFAVELASGLPDGTLYPHVAAALSEFALQEATLLAGQSTMK